MKKNIAFLSSSIEYTQGIFPFARRLEQLGYMVFWISFRGYERHWLLQKGVPNDLILDTLGTFRSDRFSMDECCERLERLENGTQPFINDIILMDRLIRRKPQDFSYAYLAHIEDVLSYFLVEKAISFVSAGRDTALQISCAKICARLEIASVVPTVVRLPDDRYGFCVGHTESEFVKVREITEEDIACAKKFLLHFREDKPIPSAVFFEKKNNQFLRRLPGDIRLLWRFFYRGFYDSDNDFTRYSIRRLMTLYVQRRFNAMHVRLFPMFEPLGSKPFVLYGYQMQPESVIDVLASFYSDQLALIKQVARSLPVSHELYVKPHPDHIGGLSRRALLEIKAIPGVRLISPFHSSHDLMKRASVVLTPAGTMGFQAPLHGVPSIIFAPEFYRKVPGVHFCSSPLELPGLLFRLLSESTLIREERIIEFFAELFSRSFVGRQTSYLGPFSEDELAGLEGAYVAAYDRLASRVSKII